MRLTDGLLLNKLILSLLALAQGFDKASSYPQTLCFLCVVYQAVIMSQRELCLPGGQMAQKKTAKKTGKKEHKKASEYLRKGPKK